MNSELKAKAKEIIIKIIILSIIEFLILIYFFKLNTFLIFIGSFGAIAGILMITEEINTLLTKPKHKITKGYMIRYAFFGIILLVAGLISKDGLFLAFLGLMNMKFAAFISPK
ncbi:MULTISPECIES: hypothetical protein [unclassified Marinitoga]|uniref:hypothetical protein n=1 Tax=unclassified Marinitoga TaxID=2640159 RepID=UPI000641272A|nr:MULTISPECIES: hypothetical protein [unclassified Marinitoga]KLO24521.1 hypothetical protein X274_03645 [Marinitoga sp. 1155]NUU99694.1 hypothetical protein [Marinitoga sp. 1154]